MKKLKKKGRLVWFETQCKGKKKIKPCYLHDDSVSCSESRTNFPCPHENFFWEREE